MFKTDKNYLSPTKPGESNKSSINGHKPLIGIQRIVKSPARSGMSYSNLTRLITPSKELTVS